MVVTNLLRLLGDRVYFSCASGKGAELPSSFTGVTMRWVTVPRLNPYSLCYVFRAARQLWIEDRPDALICVSHPFPLGFGLLMMRRFFPTKIVIRMTGDQFSERAIHSSCLVRLRKYIMHELIMPLLLRRADALLCVGEEIARQVVARGVAAKRVYILPQPINTSLFVPITVERRDEIRAEFGVGPRDRMAITVGSHTYGKGVDRLPRLLELTEVANASVHFVTIGEGPLRAELAALDAPRLHVLGPQPRERTLEIFAAADLLLHPTRRDALPNVILEAIGFGLPVVSTPVGEIAHFVSNIGDCDEELAKLVISSELAPERVPHWFDWSFQRGRYMETIDAILAEPACHKDA